MRMADFIIRIPRVSVAVSEAELVELLVADGQHVEEGASIYVIATEKVEQEIEAGATGTVHMDRRSRHSLRHRRRDRRHQVIGEGMDLNETRERIIYEKQGPIAKITLNWPEKANAQDQKQVEEMDAALLDADRDYDIKVLILKANGKGFCSGHAIGNNAVDYPEFVEGFKAMGTPWKPQTDLFVKPILNLWEFSKPTIAQVHGYCVGGGTHYGVTTDIVIASEDAYFSYPPLQGFGMPSGECSIEPWIFMNWRRAAYYLYLAEVIDAKKALEVGLVNEVVKREELDDRVEAIARHIAQAPLTTLLATKANLKRAWELMGMRVHWQSSNDLVALASISKDVQELIQQVFKDKLLPSEMAKRQAAAAASTDGAAAAT
jgi:enoyl-CoA hydratase